MFENRPFGQVAAEFSADAKPAQRGLVAAEAISKTELKVDTGNLLTTTPS